MFRDFFKRRRSGKGQEKGQGDDMPDLDAVMKAIQDIPKFCDQLASNLENSYGPFEKLAKDYFETRDRYRQEIAQLVHVRNSYEGVPGHEGDFVRAGLCIQRKVREVVWDIEVKKDAANTAFKYYQVTLNMARTSYVNTVKPMMQVPRLEAAIDQAEQRVRNWAGR